MQQIVTAITIYLIMSSEWSCYLTEQNSYFCEKLVFKLVVNNISTHIRIKSHINSIFECAVIRRLEMFQERDLLIFRRTINKYNQYIFEHIQVRIIEILKVRHN